MIVRGLCAVVLSKLLQAERSKILLCIRISTSAHFFRNLEVAQREREKEIEIERELIPRHFNHAVKNTVLSQRTEQDGHCKFKIHK